MIYNFSNGKENSSRTNFRGRLSNDWGAVFDIINSNAEFHVFDHISGGTFPWCHGAHYKKDLRLEHCVECPATSATSEWEYDTSFCDQFLDEQGKQGTASYLRYSTIANLKPVENFVTPDDLEEKVAALETTLHDLLSKKLPAGTAHVLPMQCS